MSLHFLGLQNPLPPCPLGPARAPPPIASSHPYSPHLCPAAGPCPGFGNPRAQISAEHTSPRPFQDPELGGGGYPKTDGQTAGRTDGRATRARHGCACRALCGTGGKCPLLPHSFSRLGRSLRQLSQAAILGRGETPKFPAIRTAWEGDPFNISRPTPQHR